MQCDLEQPASPPLTKKVELERRQSALGEKAGAIRREREGDAVGPTNPNPHPNPYPNPNSNSTTLALTLALALALAPALALTLPLTLTLTRCPRVTGRGMEGVGREGVAPGVRCSAGARR